MILICFFVFLIGNLDISIAEGRLGLPRLLLEERRESRLTREEMAAAGEEDGEEEERREAPEGRIRL